MSITAYVVQEAYRTAPQIDFQLTISFKTGLPENRKFAISLLVESENKIL